MKKRFLVPAILLLLLLLLALVLFLNKPEPEPEVSVPQFSQASRHGAASARKTEVTTPEEAPEPEEASETQEASQTPDAPEEPEALEVPEEPKAPYVSPIDFAALQAKNPDIYAWISIPGTNVDYPVLQRSDDTFYLSHDADGYSSAVGAIFSESAYNSTAFDDAITVLYGHRMKNGDMFGNLQTTYYSLEQLQAYQQLIIYLPEEEQHYLLFAAVPYDKRHILYHYGSGTLYSTLSFLYSISDLRGLDVVIDDAAIATGEEQLVVLSTCLYGDRTRRFLLIGKQTEILD